MWGCQPTSHISMIFSSQSGDRSVTISRASDWPDQTDTIVTSLFLTMHRGKVLRNRQILVGKLFYFPFYHSE
jgi:hypothetical protein